MSDKISGKLILTSYKKEKSYTAAGHNVACFIANGKLEYVKVIPDENTLPVGSIVTGRITNIVQNIPAAFVALNAEKDMGFLSLKDLEQAVITNRKFNGRLQAGDEILVKIIREPMKTKEYAVTAMLDMTARYAVAQTGCGRLLFSKKLGQKEKDVILSYLISKAIVTKDKQLIGMSDIDITIRTEAGKLLELTPVLCDIENTVAALRQLVSQASMRTCYSVHQKPMTWLQEVWHELTLSGYAIEEYVTDNFELFTTLQQLVHDLEAHKLRFYQDQSVALSTLYGIKTKLDELTKTKVWLPCGGYLCIEPTEALVVIDVNSGKAIQKTDTEQLFLVVNKEAAYEAARQLRLRNLSGMVIIDFINMKDKEHERQIAAYMKECVKNDFSKTTVYDFTRLGLLELTRNKKSRALHEIL